MSVQNGKVYRCVITIVLDDFVLFKYCCNNRLHGVNICPKMACGFLRFGQPSKSLFSKINIKLIFRP